MKRIYEDPVRLQRNQNQKQFTELSLKSLVQILVTFPLPAILVFYNNAISPQMAMWVRVVNSQVYPNNPPGLFKRLVVRREVWSLGDRKRQKIP
jgi:hypothetical protein